MFSNDTHHGLIISKTKYAFLMNIKQININGLIIICIDKKKIVFVQMLNYRFSHWNENSLCYIMANSFVK